MFLANITFQREEFMLDAEIKLAPGSITALLGASGSGKSTLMRLIAGLEKPLAGLIRSSNQLLYDSRAQYFVVPQERKVGMMFQQYALFNHLTVSENIAYGVVRARRKSAVSQWLQRINLTHRANHYPLELSGGEKQRVALARTLARQPEILLLDEPFSALDIMLRHELRREIQRLIRDAGVPVLLATHDLEEARLIADHVCILDQGKTVQSGPVADVFQDPCSIAVAKALGWQNILPIDHTGENYVYGPWGRLQLGRRIQKNILGIGLPKNSFSLAQSFSGRHGGQRDKSRNMLLSGADEKVILGQGNNANISAEIIHVVDFEHSQLLEVRLQGHVCLLFEHSAEFERVLINQTVNIIINPDRVKLFYC